MERIATHHPQRWPRATLAIPIKLRPNLGSEWLRAVHNLALVFDPSTKVARCGAARAGLLTHVGTGERFVQIAHAVALRGNLEMAVGNLEIIWAVGEVRIAQIISILLEYIPLARHGRASKLVVPHHTPLVGMRRAMIEKCKQHNTTKCRKHNNCFFYHRFVPLFLSKNVMSMIITLMVSFLQGVSPIILQDSLHNAYFCQGERALYILAMWAVIHAISTARCGYTATEMG